MKPYEVYCEFADGSAMYFTSFGRSPKQAIDRAKLSPQWAEYRSDIVRHGIHETTGGRGTLADPFRSRVHYAK